MPPTLPELLLVPVPRQFEAAGEGPPADASPVVRREPRLPPQGYELSLDRNAIAIAYADEAGLRYARATLAQVRAQSGARLPGLRIRDWPDYPVRGYMLDVSRDRVPTRATLERIVGLLELVRLNHLELYTEHTFAYRGHETVWRGASPITPDDVRWLDALCRERGIELSANQNTFGHMERWLKHPAYRERAEAPDGWTTSFGTRLPPMVLEPTEENARFAVSLVRELVANFESRRVNIGCDETFELGQGRSADAVRERGRGRVYLDHLLRLLRPLQDDGFDVLFWGDIVREHPELVPELPKEHTVALVWHYEAPMDPSALPAALFERFAQLGVTRESLRGFEGHVPAFADAGFPFWVCPGTSTWNTLVGRLPNARVNLIDAAEVGLARGASGYLITDWGDNGHMQPPSVSFPPLVYGAALCWCLDSNRDLPLARVLDRWVFEDESRELGETLELLGSLYAGTGRTSFNGSALHAALIRESLLGLQGEAEPEGTRRVIEQLEACTRRIERARPRCPDGEIVRSELLPAIRLARHGAWRIARAAGFPVPPDSELHAELAAAIEEQRAAWLLRSRPGGLEDSLGRLRRTLGSYSG